jgi:hypothetical protein
VPVAITALKPGDVVYDVRRVKAGNTTMSRLDWWTVRVIEVDAAAGRVVASWNGNPARTFRARDGKLSWRRTKPNPSK